MSFVINKQSALNTAKKYFKKYHPVFIKPDLDYLSFDRYVFASDLFNQIIDHYICYNNDNSFPLFGTREYQTMYFKIYLQCIPKHTHHEYMIEADRMAFLQNPFNCNLYNSRFKSSIQPLAILIGYILECATILYNYEEIVNPYWGFS